MADRSLYTTSSGPPLKSPPFLLRSRSGASRLCHSASALENSLSSPNVNISTSTPATRRAVSAARSRSTTNSRFPSDNRDAPPPQRSQQRDSKENRENHISAIFGKSQKPAGPPHAADAVPSKQRWPRYSNGVAPAPASPATSPSAWALSPGRSPASAEAPESGDRVKKKSTGRGVLGFFRQKKAPSPREEAAHQLRILFSRLLQWRFANARAEAAARVSKSNAEGKLFNVWVRVREIRKAAAAKGVLVQRVRHQRKLAAVLVPQLRLLREWDKGAGRRNVEAMAKCAGLLEAACTALPMEEGARADVATLQACISTAMEVMERIQSTVSRLYPKANYTSSLLDELVKTLKLEKEGLEELAKVARAVASLEMQELSLRAHLVQATQGQELLSKTHQNKLLFREATI